jgi:hypothetical protein
LYKYTLTFEFRDRRHRRMIAIGRTRFRRGRSAGAGLPWFIARFIPIVACSIGPRSSAAMRQQVCHPRRRGAQIG